MKMKLICTHVTIFAWDEKNMQRKIQIQNVGLCTWLIRHDKNIGQPRHVVIKVIKKGLNIPSFAGTSTAMHKLANRTRES